MLIVPTNPDCRELRTDRAAALATLFDSWIHHGDAVEQRETGEYLIRVLDEDRLSIRKLFPAEKKGVTW